METMTVTAGTMPPEHSVGAQTDVGDAERSQTVCEQQEGGRPTDAPVGQQAGNEPSGDGLQETTFCLPVKFNKQDYQLDLEQATAYAQKGMKFDTVEPILEKLKTVATANGLGVRELVDALCDGVSSVSTEERLAEEFCRLKDECPDVSTFDALPEAVVRAAVDDGVPLLYAYLQHEYRERARVKSATDTRDKASAASAGAQRSELTPAPDPTVEAMIRGVRG